MAPTGREFVQNCAAAVAMGTSKPTSSATDETTGPNAGGFVSHQERRRKELFSLLGDLPRQPRTAPPRLVRRRSMTAIRWSVWSSI